VFAVVTVATLALGVGAATSIFSIADVVLFRPLAFPDAGRLIAVSQTQPELKTHPIRAAQWDRIGFSLPGFRDWRAIQTSFDELAIWNNSTSVVGGTESPEEVGIIRASASMLAVLGVRPELGRVFAQMRTNSVDARGAREPRRVGSAHVGRSHVIGRRIRIDSVSYSIIGVLPPGTEIERNATPTSYWIPAGQEADAAHDRSNYAFRVIGRLKAPAFRSRRDGKPRLRSIRTSITEFGDTRRSTRHSTIRADQSRAATDSDSPRRRRTPVADCLRERRDGAHGRSLKSRGRAPGAHGARRESRSARSPTPDGKPRARGDRRRLDVVRAVRHEADGAIAPPWVPRLSDVHIDARVLAAHSPSRARLDRYSASSPRYAIPVGRRRWSASWADRALRTRA
jgi:hypothetical protein